MIDRRRQARGAVEWTAGLLAAAGLVVAVIGWQWATASAAQVRDRLERQREAALDGQVAAALGRLAHCVETSRAGSLPTDGIQLEVLTVADAPPEVGADTGAFLEARRLEQAGNDSAALAETYRCLEVEQLDEPTQALGWRHVARLENSGSDRTTAIDALYKAIGLAGVTDRDRLLAELELTRIGAAPPEELIERIERGEFPRVPPGERAHLAASLGADAAKLRGLRALGVLHDSEDVDAVAELDNTWLVWRMRESTGAVDVAIARRDELVSAYFPEVASGDVTIQRHANDPERSGVSLAAPFPARYAARLGPRAYAAIDSDRTAALRLRLSLTVAAAVLFIGAALALGFGARRARLLEQRKLDFVYAVTHELKTPLTNVTLAAETIERHGDSDPARMQEFARIIRAESARLAAKIQDVLDVATGRRLLGDDRETFDAVATTHAVVNEYRGDGDGRSAPIELVESSDDPATPNAAIVVRGSGELFGQALAGLLDNAIKFGSSAIRVSIDRPSRGLAVTVDDDGPGIAAGDSGRVFEPFVRAVPPEAGHVQGTGLGLTLVRQCAEGCGGAVELVTSELGGAAFRIDIPGERIRD